MKIYPKNYTKPTKEIVELTTEELTAVKKAMEDFITEPKNIGDVINIGSSFTIENYNKHISKSIFKTIALEIKEDFNPKPVIEDIKLK